MGILHSIYIGKMMSDSLFISSNDFKLIQYNLIAAQASVDWIWWLSHQIEILFTSYADLYFLEVVTAILQHL